MVIPIRFPKFLSITSINFMRYHSASLTETAAHRTSIQQKPQNWKQKVMNESRFNRNMHIRESIEFFVIIAVAASILFVADYLDDSS